MKRKEIGEKSKDSRTTPKSGDDDEKHEAQRQEEL